MSDKDAGEPVKRQARTDHLHLGAFTTIEEPPLAVRNYGERADIAGQRRSTGTCSEGNDSQSARLSFLIAHEIGGL